MKYRVALFVGIVIGIAASAHGQTNRFVCAAGDATCGGTPAYTTLALALVDVVAGDTILMKAGETFEASTILPIKAGASTANPITITTTASAANFPGVGIRICNDRASCLPLKSFMPVIRGPGVQATEIAIRNNGTASKGYLFKFIWFEPPVAAGAHQDIIRLGSSSDEEFMTNQPDEITFDRVVFSGDPIKGGLRAARLSGRNLTVKNSSCHDFHGVGQDTMCFATDNGTGPILIENNYTQASGYSGYITYGADPNSRTTATVAASPAPTTTVFTLENFRAGHTIGTLATTQLVAVQTGTTTREWSTVTNITGNQITVSPALSTPPTAGFDVRWGPIVRDVQFRRNYVTKRASWQLPLLSTPVGVTATADTSTGSLAAGTYWYRVEATATGYQNNTIRSAAASQVECVLPNTGQCTIAWTAVTNATGYRVYGRATGGQTLYFTTAGTSLSDTGTAGTAGTPGTGSRPQIKNLIELKGGYDVVIEDNIFDTNFVSSANISGAAMVWIKTVNQGCNAEYTETRDVIIRRNLWRHAAGWISFVSQQRGCASPTALDRPAPAREIEAYENLIFDSSSTWTAGSTQWGIKWGERKMIDWMIRNNTVIHTTGSTIGPDNADAHEGTVGFKDNLFVRVGVGVKRSGVPEGSASLTAAGITTFLNNVVSGASCGSYPATTICPASAAFQGAFVAYGGSALTDYALIANHAWRTASTTGGIIGADVAALNTALIGVEQGLPANQPAIQTITLPPGTVGNAYSQTLVAAGGSTPYTWTNNGAGATLNSSDAHCAGLTVSTAGVVSGTPTTAGTCDWTALVTDNAAATDTQALSIIVAAAAASPTITTTSLPSGTAGAAYSTTLTATGGAAAYVWSITAGTPPPGTSLASSTGILSGTPTLPGVFQLTFIVTSGAQTSAAASFSITIGAGGNPIFPAPRPRRLNGQHLLTFDTCTDLTIEDNRVRPGDICIDADGRLKTISATTPAVTTRSTDHFIIPMGMSIGENNITNAPAGGREYGSGTSGTVPSYRPIVDLTGVTQFRFVGYVSDASVTAGNTLRPEYSLDGSAWAQLSSVADAASMLITTVDTRFNSGWLTLAAGARVDAVELRLWQVTGDGADETGFKAVYIEVR